MNFALPSLWNLIISTIVFIVAARYLTHYLDRQEIGSGTVRSVLVLLVASAVSWGAGEIVDLAQDTPASHTPKELSQLMKADERQQ